MTDEDDVERFLEHHGVKGQKWGIRHDPESTGSKEISGKGKQTKSSKKQQAKNRAENELKFKNKFKPKEEQIKNHKEGFHITKKEVAAVALGAAFVGLIGYGAYKTANSSLLKAMPGEHISLEDYTSNVEHSKGKIWGGVHHFMSKESFERSEMTIPAGNVFHRLSTAYENSFLGSSYVTHSEEDFHRYVSIFRHEKSWTNLIDNTFTTDHPVKVPDMKTTLEIFRDSVSRDEGKHISMKDARTMYEARTGSPWVGRRPEAFFEGLKRRGFGAFVDEMDAGVIGESPLVFLDQKVNWGKGRPLTDDIIRHAESSLKEIAYRKL